MRTEKDIGSENPETTTVSGFFVLFFKVEFKRYHFPKSTFGEDLNEIQNNIRWKSLKFYDIISSKIGICRTVKNLNLSM
jgi:hypothetical protein